MNVIGSIVIPMQYANMWGYRVLFSMQIEEYKRPQEYWNIAAKINGMVTAQLTSRDAKGVERTWPLLDPSDIPGHVLWLEKPC
jgi:hypothetical protein